MGDGYRMSQSFAFPAGVASSYKGVSLLVTDILIRAILLSMHSATIPEQTAAGSRFITSRRIDRHSQTLRAFRSCRSRCRCVRCTSLTSGPSTVENTWHAP
jgi:hypothetical protein